MPGCTHLELMAMGKWQRTHDLGLVVVAVGGAWIVRSTHGRAEDAQEACKRQSNSTSFRLSEVHTTGQHAMGSLIDASDNDMSGWAMRYIYFHEFLCLSSTAGRLLQGRCCCGSKFGS